MKTYINDSWQFTPVFDKSLLSKKVPAKIKLQNVDIPHSVCETPFNYFSETDYEKVSGYRKTFKTLSQWKNKKVFITFEGAAQEAAVYLNEKLLGVHSSGYTAFTFDLTPYLSSSGKENVLAVKLDSRESLDVPPFGHAIDYLTYGGIYRDVYLEVKDEIFIEDVFVHTKGDVCTLDVTLNDFCKEESEIDVKVFKWNGEELENDFENKQSNSKKKTAEINSTQIKTQSNQKNYKIQISAQNAKRWSPETPELYFAQVELRNKNGSGEKKNSVQKKNDVHSGSLIDFKTIRFGFRDIEMKADGFYLNGKKYKIRGLDRHQSFAYVGYAMPKSVQRFDANILKNELKLNAVRTSHYPQSHDFIDACDELGLLVFTEIPGWQHIGQSEKWRTQCVKNVEEMVLQYRNHPSIFLWGVRINESPDDDRLYALTNEVAHRCDPTRPTGGVRCIKKSNLLEDVYTYNDFVHRGINEGCVSKKEVTSDMKKAYLMSEYCGHMYSTKIFDDDIHKTNHALRHAKVLNDVALQDDIAGSFGWCAFDYNTHKDFGSGDRICYHGVMDMFRNPKPAAAVYKSQCDDEPVLEISSNLDTGDKPELPRGYNYIFTNADSVKMYFNGIFIKEYFIKSGNSFSNENAGINAGAARFNGLKHPPVLIDDYIGNRFVDEEGLSESAARDAKTVLNFIALNTQIKFPPKVMASAARCFVKGVSPAKLTALYEKYVNSWRKERNVFKFEAIKNGKVVKTVFRGQSDEVKLKVTSSTQKLKIAESYDAAVIRIAATDKYDNVLSYFADSVKLSASGVIQIIGPDVTSLRGGCTGTFVRTTGKKGKGVLTVECRGMKEKIEFTVE